MLTIVAVKPGIFRFVVCVYCFLHSLNGVAGCATHKWSKDKLTTNEYLELVNHPISEWAYAVKQDMLKTAISKLSHHQMMEISPDEAFNLTGKKLTNKENRTFFLVRALMGNLGAKIIPFYDEKTLLLESRTMGADQKVMKRPLVLLLASKPKVVFITCTGDM